MGERARRARAAEKVTRWRFLVEAYRTAWEGGEVAQLDRFLA